MARGEAKGCEQDIECDCYSDRNDVVNVFSVNVQYINFIFVPSDSCPALLLSVKYSYLRELKGMLWGVYDRRTSIVCIVSRTRI